MPRSFRRLLPLALLALFALPLQACAVAAVGAAGTAVGTVAQERPVDQASSDAMIRVELNDLWFRTNIDMYRAVNLSISEGRLLLTGVVAEPQMREDAVRTAWQIEGVREVINEIEVGDRSFGDFAGDNAIAATLRSNITFDSSLQSLNYSIDVIKGVVYLLGIAQDRGELERVLAHARSISGVQRVVSYVRLKTDPLPPMPPRPPESATVPRPAPQPYVRQPINRAPSLPDTDPQVMRGPIDTVGPAGRDPR